MRLVAESRLRTLGITEVLTAEMEHVFVTAELPMELQVLEEVRFRHAAEGILALNLLETGVSFLALNEQKIEPPLVLTRRDGKMILKDYSGVLAENGRLIRKEDEVEAGVSEVFLICFGNAYLSFAEQEEALHHLETDLRLAMPYLSMTVHHELVQPEPSFCFCFPEG